jgi:hypothetical protein
MANRLRGYLLGDDTPDSGCGLKIFPRKTFIALPYFDHIHRFLAAPIKRLSGTIVVVEVSHRNRQFGQSKYNMLGRLGVGLIDMLGSYGLIYFRHFPQNKRHFTPDCQGSDIQNCTQQELINTCDNTIAYTDFVLSKIIEKLTELEQTKDIETSMLYISDHGESLGEKGVYLHGLPYAFAPSEQTHVPMIYWQGSEMLDKNSG